MKRLITASLGVCALAVVTPAAAASVTAEANLARSEGDWGGELAVGVPVIQDGGFAITPAVGAFFHKRDHDGYHNENSQCIRKSDGEQVSDGKCDDSGTKIFGKVEATYTLPMSFSFGLGARFIGDNLRGYGTVVMPLAPFIDVKGNIGDHYLAAGVQARF